MHIGNHFTTRTDRPQLQDGNCEQCVLPVLYACPCVWLWDKNTVCDEGMWADNEGPLYLLVERWEEDSGLD